MVFIFIFATAGLLIWAAIKPWVGRWVDVSVLPVLGTIMLSPLDRLPENGRVMYQSRAMNDTMAITLPNVHKLGTIAISRNSYMVLMFWEGSSYGIWHGGSTAFTIS